VLLKKTRTRLSSLEEELAAARTEHEQQLLKKENEFSSILHAKDQESQDRRLSSSAGLSMHSTTHINMSS